MPGLALKIAEPSSLLQASKLLLLVRLHISQVESGPGQCLVDEEMRVTCEECHENLCPLCKEYCSEDQDLVKVITGKMGNCWVITG